MSQQPAKEKLDIDYIYINALQLSKQTLNVFKNICLDLKSIISASTFTCCILLLLLHSH